VRLLLILALAASSLVATPAFAQVSEPLRFGSCAALRSYLASRQPHEQVRLAPQSYECSEPPVLSVDGLTVDFGGSLIRVADNALRPGVVVGDLHTPPEQRHRAITVRNLRVEGNREHQRFECWDGPCNPAANPNPLWRQRLNGITVNGCDDCALIDVEVHGARSGGVVVVSSNRLLVDGMQASGSYFDGLAAYETAGSLFRNLRVHDNDYAGLSFDCDFSGNRIEDFSSSGNRDHGVFIRHAAANHFARGTLSGNALDGVYFDRARPSDPHTCAVDTRLENVTISGSGRYGAWLDFACGGNRFVTSRLEDNALGCFGGREADLIERSDTECIEPEQSAMIEAMAELEHDGSDRGRLSYCRLVPRSDAGRDRG
jgi:hypothetical protein